jgi:outer membrane lipoprotein-sorting protein
MTPAKNLLLLMMCLPLSTIAQKIDTVSVFKRLASDLSRIRNISYDYKMTAKFPSGDKDKITGTIYLNMDEKIYYNDCGTYTMIYAPRWMYNADHKNNVVEVTDLNKRKDKKMRKEREKEIFQSNAVNSFLDSVLLKKAGVLKELRYTGSTYTIAVAFIKQPKIKKMTLVFDTLKNTPVSCNMILSELYEATSGSNKSVELNVDCSNFTQGNGKNSFSLDDYFTCNKNRIKLKKYTNYKLITQ